MSVPDLVPIRHEPDYRTRTVGRWGGGQYFGSLTGAGDERFCAVLHEFDDYGRHLRSRIRFTDGEPDAVAAAEGQLAAWLGELPDLSYETIAVAPFSVTHENVLFGLVVESQGEYPEGEEQDDWAELYPDGLGFSSPWDGLYDT
jgi:formate hydrogenlyase regulatory protein HycA